MKKMYARLIILLFFAFPSEATGEKEYDYSLGDIICSTFLLGTGTWLAHKQLPRLVGQQIEFNAPIFTKVLASIFFAIGITGSTIGTYILAEIGYHNYQIRCQTKEQTLISFPDKRGQLNKK